jgi:hypothetical protein
MFLMSSILLGGLLAGIPILLHMLRRQNTVPIAWGAMQFLLETPLRARRRHSVDNWLLMLVRIGILLFLAFALARPLVRGTAFVTSTPVDVAVVIDHSLSMGRRGSIGGAQANGTLFDEGVKDAEHLAGMLPASASMSIILAEHAAKVVTPLPIAMDSSNKSLDNLPRGEWENTLRQLHELKPGITEADIPQAVQAATELLNRGHNLRKLILIISDQQRSNWSIGSDSAWHAALGGERAADAGTAPPVYSLAVVPPASSPNLSVGSIAVQPPFLGIHRPAQITATIANTGTTDLSNIPLQLLIDGHVAATQQLSALAPGKSNTAHFDEYFPEAGSHWVQIRADIVDGLEADNAATSAVTVSPQLPVLVVDGQLTSGVGGRNGHFPAADFLLFAMQPMDPSVSPDTLIVPKVISVADIDTARLEDFPIVVLNDVPRLPAATVARLAAYTQSGHGLWIILGPRTRDSFLTNILAKSPLLPATVKSSTTVATPVSIDIRDPDNPTVAVVTAAQRNALAGATVSAWWSLTRMSPDMHTILATTTGEGGTNAGGGDPLVTEMSLGNNGGRVILWTTSAYDPAWNNLPVVPNFTPLVNETLLHLASSQAQAQSRDLDAGQTLLWSGPALPPIDSATLESPNGAAHPVQPELRGDRYILTSNDTHAPGLYELHFSPPSIPQPVYYSVKIDRAELDPAILSSADFDWLKTNHYLRDNLTPATLPKALNAQVGGAELWWLLAVMVLALLVIEAFLTSRMVKQQTTVDPETAGLLTPSRTAGGLL